MGRQMLNALCINYTAAYCCDLMTDRMITVKQKEFSHSARSQEGIRDTGCYSEWIRYSFEHFIVKEESPDFLDVFDAENMVRRLKKEESFVYPHRTLPNGIGMEYFEATVVRLYADESSFKVIIGYRPIDDIIADERKHRAELENEVTALRNIHEALGSGAWKLGYNEHSEMTSCKWSDTMRHMLGFTSTEDFPDVFEAWSDRLHPDDKERTLAEYRDTLHDCSNKKTYDVEYRVCAKDGTYHWFRAAGRLSRRPDGSPIAFDGVFINTDEKHRTSEQLHRALAEAEAAKDELLLEHEVISAVSRSYFSIYTIDLVRNFCEEISNSEHSVHHLTGHGGDAQKKLCELCDTLVDEEYRPAVMRFFDLSSVADRMEDSDAIGIDYLASDGNWHQVHFIEKKRDETGRVTNILYVTRIVSKQKQQEMEQERLRIAYQVAERANEAKTTFLLNMSHDIRTPMNAILGYSGLMRNKLTDPELIRYQDRIEQSGELLLSIINNVLDMARIESGKMELDETYNRAGDIVSGVCAVFESEAKRKNLTIEHIVDVEHQDIMCDRTKMQEVLTNIISNAVKYTPAGGRITITTRELSSDNDGHVSIETCVEDTGIGMSEEFLPHLFDSFTRERNTTDGGIIGSGLGMAIVKSLVDLMGGKIAVESKLGKGTRFSVVMRHKTASSEYYEKKTLPKASKEVDFSGKRVLLAEDNALNAEIATIILNEMGFEVDHAEDGVICVDKLEKADPGTYDLILMDVQMPNMDGYKATQVIRRLPDRRKAATPIVAMTANAFEEDRKKAIEMGMNDHLAKPLEIEKLAAVAAMYCGGK